MTDNPFIIWSAFLDSQVTLQFQSHLNYPAPRGLAELSNVEALTLSLLHFEQAPYYYTLIEGALGTSKKA